MQLVVVRAVTPSCLPEGRYAAPSFAAWVNRRLFSKTKEAPERKKEAPHEILEAPHEILEALF